MSQRSKAYLDSMNNQSAMRAKDDEIRELRETIDARDATIADLRSRLKAAGLDTTVETAPIDVADAAEPEEPTAGGAGA